MENIICRRIWKRKRWIEKWNNRLIAPVLKMGERSKIEDYREVTLMATLNKIYAEVIAEKLRKEIEGKKLILENQVVLGEKEKL